jgi:hypothetical protein
MGNGLEDISQDVVIVAVEVEVLVGVSESCF